MSRSSPALISRAESDPAPARLGGWRLIAARLAWLLILAISVAQVLFGAPAEFALYATPCLADCGGSLLTPASVQQL